MNGIKIIPAARMSRLRNHLRTIEKVSWEKLWRIMEKRLV